MLGALVWMDGLGKNRNMKNTIKFSLVKKISLASALLLSGMSLALACTDFRLVAADGSVLITRSMEFAIDMKSNLMTSPRGREFKTTTPNQKEGLSWKSKYGYLFLDGMGLGVPLEGMNEHGLAYEALLFPGEAEYQTIPENKEKRAISYVNFGDWILGNFKTVDEVREALQHVYVYEQTLPQLNNAVFPIHFSIYEASGKGIVVEYVKGELHIYDNHIGVMTNSPTYDWHITNLRNYVNLTPVSPKPIVDNGVTFSATGQGAGMLGLPGDISPPSRFVKMAVMSKTVNTPADALAALNTAQHMINNVDIPLGFVREAQKEGTATNELTQWVVFKDLTHKILYYRTYDDLTLHAVDMNKLDFSENAPALKMPIASKPFILDMTPQFMGSNR